MENEEKKLRKQLFNGIIDLIGLIVYIVLFVGIIIRYVFYNKEPDNFMVMIVVVMAITFISKKWESK